MVQNMATLIGNQNGSWHRLLNPDIQKAIRQLVLRDPTLKMEQVLGNH